MKKSMLLAVIAVLAVAAVGQASVISFSWGTPFYQLSTKAIQVLDGGVSGSINWYVDDMSFGIQGDTVEVHDPNRPFWNAGNMATSELTVDKWLSKSVAVGIGIGTTVQSNDFSTNRVFSSDGAAGTAVDIRGLVHLLEGKGDKINGSLDFGIAERFITVPGQETRWPTFTDISTISATVASLSVTLGL